MTGVQTCALPIYPAGRADRVYLNIPAGGQGEVRVLVSGRVTMAKARAVADGEIPSGRRVRVTRLLDQSTMEVETINSNEETGKEGT